MRGTKLEAWRVPPFWNDLRENALKIPEGSRVPQNQQDLIKATEAVLEAIAADVRGGLLETVGVESRFSSDDGRSAIILDLPEGADNELIARAIDAENVEAWTDADGRVRVGINPWYSTKDVDQTVLSTVKIIHVMLGLHASDAKQPKTFKQKLLKSIRDIMEIQKSVKR